ncbi:MAG: hypothetical protein QM692_14005 [Thermomicrobiales bacterium]
MPALAGGPPVRGELLPIRELAGPLAASVRAAWLRAAQRIAAGVWELAHLPVTIDDEQMLLAFIDLNDPGVTAAADWVQAIRSENVEARLLLDGAGQAGVQLPCAPDFGDEEIRHVVLACVKAAHVGAEPLPGDAPDDVVAWRDL